MGLNYDAIFLIAAIGTFILIGLRAYNYSQIKKIKDGKFKISTEIIHEEAYEPDNRIELARPFASPPSDFHPYPQLETVRKYCEVCNREILPSDMVYECPKCNYRAHRIHLAEWFRTHNECPNCLG